MSRSTKGSWKRVAGKKRWTEADARRVVEAWRASGLPLQTFAREQGVGAWRLRWWAPRVEASEGRAGSKRKASAKKAKASSAERWRTPRLVPAVVAEGVLGSGQGPAVVVRLPDGIEVELRDVARVEAEEIGRLVAELRRAR